MSTTKKQAAEVRVGDVIVSMGSPHLIARIEPYAHPTIGATYGIAKAAGGWGITLLDGTAYEVASLP